MRCRSRATASMSIRGLISSTATARPSSGDHYPTPAGYGVFTREIAGGNPVHTLEHGGIVVYYRPDLCQQACVAQLQRAYSSASKSQRYGLVKMVVTPLVRYGSGHHDGRR